MDPSQRVRAILSFVHAAERGSLAAAARALGISAAAVSKNVASLERGLGIRLVNRTTRSLQLTAEGSAFLERARVAIAALDDAIEAVAAQRAEPMGRVRISTSNAFGRSYLLPLIPGLHRYSFSYQYNNQLRPFRMMPGQGRVQLSKTLGGA